MRQLQLLYSLRARFGPFQVSKTAPDRTGAGTVLLSADRPVGLLEREHKHERQRRVALTAFEHGDARSSLISIVLANHVLGHGLRRLQLQLKLGRRQRLHLAASSHPLQSDDCKRPLDILNAHLSATFHHKRLSCLFSSSIKTS